MIFLIDIWKSKYLLESDYAILKSLSDYINESFQMILIPFYYKMEKKKKITKKIYS